MIICLWLIALLVITPAAASAHVDGSPEVQVWIDPSIDLGGVEVDVATRLAPAVRLRSTDGSAVTLLDEDGRGIVRVSADGVEGNLAAPRWYSGNDPTGVVAAPDDLPVDDEWVLVSEATQWEQYDHRLHPQPLTPTLEAVQAGEDAVLATTTLPFEVAGETIEVPVTTLFRPSVGLYRTRLSDADQPEGVTVGIRDATMPRVTLRADAGATPVVLDEHGEAMLRVLGDGTVEANLNSETWREVQRSTVGLVPDGLPGGVPEWVPVGAEGSVEWPDPRVDPAPPEPSDPTHWLLEDNDVLTTTIDIEFDGQRVPVEMTVVWTRFGDPGQFLEDSTASDDGGPPGWVRIVAVVGVAAAAVVLLRGPARRGR